MSEGSGWLPVVGHLQVGRSRAEVPGGVGSGGENGWPPRLIQSHSPGCPKWQISWLVKEVREDLYVYREQPRRERKREKRAGARTQERRGQTGGGGQQKVTWEGGRGSATEEQGPGASLEPPGVSSAPEVPEAGDRSR